MTEEDISLRQRCRGLMAAFDGGLDALQWLLGDRALDSIVKSRRQDVSRPITVFLQQLTAMSPLNA